MDEAEEDELCQEPFCPSCNTRWTEHDGMIKTCRDKQALEKRYATLCLLEECHIAVVADLSVVTITCMSPASSQLLWLALNGIKRELIKENTE
jgi:hypothetical protein